MRHFRYATLLAVVFTLAITGCDTTSGAPPDLASEFVVVKGSDGQDVRVHLVNGTPSDHRSFDSREAVQQHLDATESGESFVVSRSNWEALKHALPPSTIALFDENASLTVGETAYEARQDGVYSRPASDPSASFTVDLFYGENGEAEGDEYALVAANSNDPAALTGLKLQNPHVRDLANRIADAGGMDAAAAAENGDSANARSSAAAGTNSCPGTFWESCAYVYANFRQNPSCSGICVGQQIRLQLYNESSGSLWYKKAYAGTQPAIQNSSGVWSPAELFGTNAGYGRLRFGHTVFGQGQYVGIPGYFANADCTSGVGCSYSISAECKRSSGREAISLHSWVDDNGGGVYYLD